MSKEKIEYHKIKNEEKRKENKHFSEENKEINMVGNGGKGKPSQRHLATVSFPRNPTQIEV